MHVLLFDVTNKMSVPLSDIAVIQERDKLYLARCIILELVQALKFKESLPDENLIMLVQVSRTSRSASNSRPLYRSEVA